VPLWRFYVQCGIEETSSPGIIYIVCNEVLRHPSDHGTSSIGNYFLRTVYIAKLYKVTQSEVTKLSSSTVDETTLSIMNKKDSRGNRIVSLQRRSKLDFQVLFILTKLTEITLQTGSEGLWYCLLSPRHLESLPHIRICFGSYFMVYFIMPSATIVIQLITKHIGATILQHAVLLLPEGMPTHSVWN
jgi:hypothetical protein